MEELLRMKTLKLLMVAQVRSQVGLVKVFDSFFSRSRLTASPTFLIMIRNPEYGMFFNVSSVEKSYHVGWIWSKQLLCLSHCSGERWPQYKRIAILLVHCADSLAEWVRAYSVRKTRK